MLRVGIVDYLNSRPLARGLLQGQSSDRFIPTCHSPAQVARMLAAGELEIGLIPSIEVQRIPGLSVLPGLCVAATHEVRSVLLVCDGEVESIRRVALDENSRTSAALVKIVLAERYDLSPTWVTTAPRLDEMLSSCDAALVIGDVALQVDRRRHRVLDLAAEWRLLTGMPFVFAVWAVTAAVDDRDLAAPFHASLRCGLREIDEIVAEAAIELGLEVPELRTYLTENLSFQLEAAEREGLEEFYRRAAAHGLLDSVTPLRFQGETSPDDASAAPRPVPTLGARGSCPTAPPPLE